MKKISLFLTLALFVSIGIASNVKFDGKNGLPGALEVYKAKKQATTNSLETEAPTLMLESGKTAYGFCVFDKSWGQNPKYGLYSFSTSTPATTSKVWDKSKPYDCGVYFDGHYYVQSSKVNAAETAYESIEFGKLNAETGEYEMIVDWIKNGNNAFFSSMTYDYSTNNLIGLVQTAAKQTTLVKVDLETGLVDYFAKKASDGLYGPVGCNYDGAVYAINVDGTFTSIDTKTGVATKIGKTGESIIVPGYSGCYPQAMSFDHNDGTLYWAVTTGGGAGKFGAINIETGKFTSNGKLGGDAEMVTLHIPFETPSDESFAVTIEIPENGTLEVRNGTTIVNSGDMIKNRTSLTIKATPNEGYTLDAIKVNGATIDGTTCKITAATTIAAVFVPGTGVDNADVVNFSIYPNPVREAMNIEGDFTSVNVYNSVGQCVGTYSAETTKINVGDLSEGIYVVRVYNGDSFSTRKIIIKK